MIKTVEDGMPYFRKLVKEFLEAQMELENFNREVIDAKIRIGRRSRKRKELEERSDNLITRIGQSTEQLHTLKVFLKLSKDEEIAISKEVQQEIEEEQLSKQEA